VDQLGSLAGAVKFKEIAMAKKSFLLLATTAAFTLVLHGAAFAAAKKRAKNSATIYSTGPSTLPVDVPYTNRRNRDWLGGYLGNDGYNDENFEEEIITSPRRRDGRERRRWRRQH
jgi:hypothetical protein